MPHANIKAPVGFDRINKQPLDKYDVFTNTYQYNGGNIVYDDNRPVILKTGLSNFIDYLNNGASYAGQSCKVETVTKGKYARYNVVESSFNGLTAIPSTMYGSNDIRILSTSNIKSIYSMYSDSITDKLNTYRQTHPGVLPDISYNDAHWIMVHNFRKNARTLSNYQYEYNMDYSYYNYFTDLDLFRWDQSNNYMFMALVTKQGEYEDTPTSSVYVWTQKKHPFLYKSAETEQGYFLKFNKSITTTANQYYWLSLINYKDGTSYVLTETQPSNGSMLSNYYITIFALCEKYVKAANLI